MSSDFPTEAGPPAPSACVGANPKRRRPSWRSVCRLACALEFLGCCLLAAGVAADDSGARLRPRAGIAPIREVVPQARTVTYEIEEDLGDPAAQDFGMAVVSRTGAGEEHPLLAAPGADLPPIPEYEPTPASAPGIWTEPPVYTVDPYAEEVSLPFLACDDEMTPLERFHYFNQSNGDIGIGHERVMFATFETEPSQPSNNLRLRYASSYGLQTPDRAEYIWAKIGGKGPMFPETRVDYQDLRFTLEAGQGRFSFITDVPMRLLDPEINEQTSGLGNIGLTPKVVLVDGQRWQISQVFRTALATGSARAGSSNGHLALEPGVLIRYRWSCSTYVHSQFKYWIPLGGTEGFMGYVGTFGGGISHVWYETDSFAVIPVFEVMGYSVGGGAATLPTGQTVSASTTFANILPGVRFVLGPEGDLGICELGVFGGFCTNDTGWYQQQLGVELKWSF